MWSVTYLAQVHPLERKWISAPCGKHNPIHQRHIDRPTQSDDGRVRRRGYNVDMLGSVTPGKLCQSLAAAELRLKVHLSLVLQASYIVIAPISGRCL